jgi:hypothetical protein
MAVTGNNPWDVDTRDHGVKLRAVWDQAARLLMVIVTAAGTFVTPTAIWDKLDPLMKKAIGG